MRTDVCVIGGGPAGLAAGIAARLKGLDVTVIDAAHPPVDKACGEAVLPAGVAALRQLGVALCGEGFPIRGIRFLSGGASVEAGFPSGCGLALRRTSLHRILVARAAELGVRLLWDTPVTDPALFSRCRWLVGADGQNSRVRRAAGLEAVAGISSRFGFRRHHRLSPWTDFVEVYWGRSCQIYVTPVSADEIGIALLSRDPHLRLDGALPQFPDLRRKLRGAETSSAERGAPTVSRRLRRVFRGTTVLIGDASGSADAITGDGLSLSFRQAVALSRALSSGDLEAYQAEHARLARRPALIAAALLLLDRCPALRRAVLGVLAFEPPIFAKLLTSHAS